MFPFATSIPDMVGESLSMLKKCFTTKLYFGLFILLNGLNLMIVKHFSLRHPFLDSDNRHYAQKYYKFIISTPRHMWMVPVYSFLMLLNYKLFKKRAATLNTSVMLFFWVVCSAATLVLTPLFELRYFVVPWILLAVEVKNFRQESRS